MKDDSAELRRDRFFFRKSCAYCGSCDNLQLDSIKPYSWIGDDVWQKTEYEIHQLLVTDAQVLCDVCLRRKKQVWKAYKKEGGAWLQPYLEDGID